MLVAYMREDGFYLELPELQRGLMWAVGRLAQVNPQLLIKNQVHTYLPPYLTSDDHLVRAGAAYALGILGCKEVKEALETIVHDARPVTLYVDCHFNETTLGNIAAGALSLLE